MLNNAIRSTNIDESIGKQVIVRKEISKFVDGEIKLHDVIYTACLMEEETEIERGRVGQKERRGIIVIAYYFLSAVIHFIG